MDYWHRQTPEKPLFEDILWSRPENKRSAGKLLIIGGQQNSFSDSVRLYESALNAGAGSVRVLLPESLQKTIGTHLEHVWFAPSNNSGSFSRQALAIWLEHAAWADGVIISGDIGKNSETAIALESLSSKYEGQMNFIGECSLQLQVKELIRRPDTLITVNPKQLQKILIEAHSMHAVYSGMQLNQLVEALHLFTGRFAISILSMHSDSLVVASGGEVASQTGVIGEMWQNDCAASASVFWLQNPEKTFRALTTSLTN